MGHKTTSEESQNEAKRKRILNQYLGQPDAPKQFADPAALFGLT